jgi:hypothetical protein
MQQIIRNAVFLILIIFSLLKLPAANAMDYSTALNFDKAKPIKTLTLTKSIPTTFAAEKVDGVQIEVNEPLSGANVKQTIPAVRMRLLLNGHSFQLANSTVTINFADQIKTANLINLALALTINPEDRADYYTGKITLKTWVNETAGKKWQNIVAIKLAVEIQPWIKMQCDSNQIVLDQVNYSQAHLANLQPLHLLIASNSNWILTCRLNDINCELRPKVKIISGQTNRLQVFNQNQGITVNRQNLASGTATATSNSYWLNLGVEIELTDVIKYAAKEYNIPLQFTVLLWDGKSAIP